MTKYLDPAVTARINSLRGDERHYDWGRSIGWNDGIINSVFHRGQVPGPRDLVLLAAAERVSINWLLTGDGTPYQVTPPPEPQYLAVDASANYYLFDRPDGLQPPLICVRNGIAASDDGPTQPSRHVTVYDGSPGDLLRAVEWLAWRGRPIFIVEDGADAAARLRSGRAGNRLLFNEGKGLLERALPVLPTPRMAVSALVEDRRAGYWAGASTLNEIEREWVMRYRELDDEQRAALLLVARGLARGERGT